MSGLPAELAFDLGGALPVPVQIDVVRDNAAEMIARLPEHFRRKTDDPNPMEKLLTACAGEVQALWTACKQVLLQRTVDNAIGQQLDDIGKLVGQERDGLDDDTFRRRVRARISVHRSKGTFEDVIRVTSLIIFDDNATIRVEQQSYATIVVHVENVSVSATIADSTLFGFLQAVVGAGMRVLLHSGTTSPSTWFRLDTGPGLDSGIFTDSRG